MKGVAAARRESRAKVLKDRRAPRGRGRAGTGGARGGRAWTMCVPTMAGMRGSFMRSILETPIFWQRSPNASSFGQKTVIGPGDVIVPSWPPCDGGREGGREGGRKRQLSLR